IIQTPVGQVAISCTEDALAKIDFLNEEHHLTDFSNSKKAEAIADKTATKLLKYFAGEETAFDVPVTFEGTEFQESVWRQIAAIPFGSTLSYGDIAKAIGKPKASRAVGGAVGANPIPIIIGCHRVMGATGKLTGYSGGEGIETKVQLLELEGIAHR
ncbi:MAG: methylated-DNA--[protein]-cysteine S-methyltransferase, partial [Aquiluna sp.]